MQRLFSAKPLLAIALVAGSFAAASGAHAGSLTDAFVSVTVQTPGGRHVQAAPVVVQPAPVYVQHAPAYDQRRVVQGPQRRDDARNPWGDVDHDGIANRYDRHDDRRYGRHDDRRDDRVAYRSGWGDNDHDGVPNRYDRQPNNPYRR